MRTFDHAVLTQSHRARRCLTVAARYLERSTWLMLALAAASVAPGCAMAPGEGGAEQPERDHAAEGAAGTTYYVSTTGNDDGPCDEARDPSTSKRTVAAGLGCLAPGDTLAIRGGTYEEALYSSTTTIPSGTDLSANAITIKAYPGEAVVLQAPPGAAVLHLLGQHHLIFDSLIFDGNGKTGGTVSVDGYPSVTDPDVPHTHHVRFRNCEFRGSYGEITVGHSHDIEFIGGSVHDNDDDTGYRHGFYISEVADVLVDSMQIYNNLGYGVHIYGGGNDPYHSMRVTVRNNVVYNNATAQGQWGIIYADGSDGLVYNNVVYANGNANGGGGIAVGHAGASNNIGVFNNTVIGNAGGPGAIYIAAGSGNIVRNNIIWNNQPTDYVDLGTGAIADHNLIGVDPLFVDEAAHDYRLREGSPAIGAGVDVGLPYQGSAPDLGALQSGEATGTGGSGAGGNCG